jgi:acetolactate synthase small subunit
MTMIFRVRAEAEPQSLSRMIDQFAQRGLIPSMVAASQIGHGLEVVIEHPTIQEDVAQIICDRIARLPPVEDASVHRLQTR